MRVGLALVVSQPCGRNGGDDRLSDGRCRRWFRVEAGEEEVNEVTDCLVAQMNERWWHVTGQVTSFVLSLLSRQSHSWLSHPLDLLAPPSYYEVERSLQGLLSPRPILIQLTRCIDDTPTSI